MNPGWVWRTLQRLLGREGIELKASPFSLYLYILNSKAPMMPLSLAPSARITPERYIFKHQKNIKSANLSEIRAVRADTFIAFQRIQRAGATVQAESRKQSWRFYQALKFQGFRFLSQVSWKATKHCLCAPSVHFNKTCTRLPHKPHINEWMGDSHDAWREQGCFFHHSKQDI